MEKDCKFYVTKHCIKRYIERVLLNVRCETLMTDILTSIYTSTNITGRIANEYPRYILHAKETYKNSIQILKKGDIIFITTKDKKSKYIPKYNVLTCYKGEDNFKKYKNTVLTNKQIHEKLSILKIKHIKN